MAYRFYLTPLPAVGEVAVLTGDQSHHAANVMRYQVGQRLELFDGAGGEASCTIQAITKKQLAARVDSVEHHPQPQDRMLAVAVALPKGDRQKFLVEKLVELGVQFLIPLQTTRGVAEPNSKARTRIERQIIEATKQCQRKWLMKLEPGMLVGQVSDWMAAHSLTEVQRVYGDPYEGDLIGRVVSEGWTDYVVLIGPEGGFTDDETGQADKDGFLPIRIGSHVLRVETAAIATAAILGPGSQT